LALSGARDAADDLFQSTIEWSLRQATRQTHPPAEDSLYASMRAIWRRARRTERLRRLVERSHRDEPVADGRRVVEWRERLRTAERCIAGLPLAQARVLNLVVEEGQTYRDAADNLGVPIGTIMSRLARARTAIAAAL
jgi:RNA polymerase sigma-70 factor, ECF subfamily